MWFGTPDPFLPLACSQPSGSLSGCCCCPGSSHTYLCAIWGSSIVTFPLPTLERSQVLRGCPRARAPGCQVVPTPLSLRQLLLLMTAGPTWRLGQLQLITLQAVRARTSDMQVTHTDKHTCVKAPGTLQSQVDLYLTCGSIL